MNRLQPIPNIRQSSPKQHRHSIRHISFRRFFMKLSKHNPSLTPLYNITTTVIHNRHASISVSLWFIPPNGSSGSLDGSGGTASGGGGEESEVGGSAAEKGEACGGSERGECEESECGRECHGGRRR